MGEKVYVPNFKTSIFIFRRDLRLSDNTGLLEALNKSESVLPCFIFDPRQIGDHDYKSSNALEFMVQSLQDLGAQLQKKGADLYIFHGEAHTVLEKLIKEVKADAVFVNRDYTPFSIHRDYALADLCRQHKVFFSQSADCLLNEPESITKKDGGVYTVFTPFFKKALSVDIRPPQKNTHKHYLTKKISFHKTRLLDALISKKNHELALKGGRQEGLKILKALKDYRKYDEQRDIPSLKGTTGLSPHHKFGTVSIREVYHAVKTILGKDHSLIREIFWRDFFTHIGFHYPQVLGAAFQEKYNRLKWVNDPKLFQAWCEGKTGFPLVDAGMRELNTTGFMHNRVRMVTASFLVKDLHIDWRWGEKYFAQKLIDYDPLVNNGNWQWAASTGCDAQPYFRIFNPWRQQERFDPQCLYIKKWIPELKDIDPKVLHKLEKSPLTLKNYPQPVVDHKTEAEKSKKSYKILK
ncbi:MAG: deoxyribodipyrimidine photo-lyase [Candidatus Omnitrophica bacterium]|nr:deoxyribodipyrimidine photo-lyase [Candidatus Omnitrophota bacterium]